MTAPPKTDHTTEVTAKIGKGIRIRGELLGSESILVEGVVDGAITAPGCQVVVGPTATVTGDISAGSIEIAGSVKGNLSATDYVEIHRVGSLTGDVVTHRISIQDGAFFRGGIDIRRTVRASELKSDPISLILQFDPSLSPQSISATLVALADYYRACGGLGFLVDDLHAEQPRLAEALFA